ncbi:MAG: HAMP domain-containing histidine kinase [Anaerolineae bacterium]|nr:HAMP domain-containing histidine kinase [Anaerolineae bacterium]
MAAERQIAGIVLLCDLDGLVRQVIRNDLSIADQLAPGRSFALAVDRASLAKALSFMVELRANGAVFDWAMNVPTDGEITTLHFAGIATGDSLLIVGARSSDEILKLAKEMASSHDDHMNVLHAALEACVKRSRTQTSQNVHFYDELSRLNNEMANLQRELAKKNVDLEKLNQLKNQFLGMAAHDLRTPLGIIMTYSEFLMDELAGVLNEEHERFLDIIFTSSQFMLQIVNDLLDVATIESGQLTLYRWPTDLTALVRRSVDLFATIAQKKDVQLLCYADESLPLLMIDRDKIDQVLNNLLSNAIKYSYPDGLVEVRVSSSDDHAVISVKDHGQGIPTDERDNLFQWFGTTRTKGTAGEKSTGLGLAIAHKIITGHEGRIWFESEVGQGSTFYVSLPVDELSDMLPDKE